MSRYVSWLANTALFVLCCFLVANMANAVFAALLDAGTAVEAPPPPAAPTARSGWAEREVIVQRNLFHSSLLAVQEPEEEVVEEPEDLEATRLPLTLLGTAAAEETGFSWAAVEDREARKTLVVRVGDEIAGGKASVLRIERRRIVLNEKGAPRELVLGGEEDGEGSLARIAASRRAPTRRPSPSRTSRRQTATDARLERLRKLAEDRYEVPREDVEETVRNPANLFSQARILPKYEEGEMVGVQINAIKPGSVFEDLGIQSGDVITELNGIEISSPEDSAAILREFQESTEFTIVVEGDDGPRTITTTLTD